MAYLCSCLLLFFVAREITAHNLQKRATGTITWLTVKKSDLCPALQKEIVCLLPIDIDDVLKGIGNVANTSFIPAESLHTGKESLKCGNPVKDALCSDTSPLCLEDREKSGENSGARKVCDELYNKCLALKNEESLRNFTKYCEEYLMRKYTDMTCKTVGPEFADGVCPRPTKKVPAFYIPVYETKSESLMAEFATLEKLNAQFGEPMSSTCMKTMKHLACLPIYCSDQDDNLVEIMSKKRDCDIMMECVTKATDVLPTDNPLIQPVMNQVKGFVQDSCDSMINTFERLVQAEGNKTKPTGCVARPVLERVLLLFFSLALKVFW